MLLKNITQSLNDDACGCKAYLKAYVTTKKNLKAVNIIHNNKKSSC